MSSYRLVARLGHRPRLVPEIGLVPAIHGPTILHQISAQDVPELEIGNGLEAEAEAVEKTAGPLSPPPSPAEAPPPASTTPRWALVLAGLIATIAIVQLVEA